MNPEDEEFVEMPMVARRMSYRATRLSPDLIARHPGVQERLELYRPAALALARLVIIVLTLLSLLEAWGLGGFHWVITSQLSGRLLNALSTMVMALALAILVWEAANATVQRYLTQLSRQAQLARSARLRTLLPMFRTALLIGICVVVALVILNELGVNIAPLLAGAGVLGLAIGFGSQKLVQDIITGLFLLLENTMQVGDWVTLGGLSGTVENLSVRTIQLRALDGAVHIIPFSAVTTVTNNTRDFGFAVFDVSVGLNEQPDRIGIILHEIAEGMRAEPRWADVILDKLEVMGVDRFLNNAWVMKARLRTLPSQRAPVGREFNRRLKYRFDELAVESPLTSYAALKQTPPQFIQLMDGGSG